ncbi:penicillin acylase family protein [Pendulispora albinea]|uniref:Penicillin acylase family protein n=1 Tax=Pendulispora albinea TaxID=2741071 RepID=A0ABZ2MC85_9BACT
MTNRFGWIIGIAMLAGGCSSGDGLVDVDPEHSNREQLLASDIYLNAMPPGSNGNSAGGLRGIEPLIPTLYPPNFTDALPLYGDLAYAKRGLKSETCAPPKDASEHTASSDLACNYFKREALVPDVVKSTSTLRTPDGKQVTLQRDGWGVPFIDAPDRQAAMYGFGYASAQDRLWLHDVLRHIGRGRLSEYLGPAQFFYDFDANFATLAGYSEEELTAMVESTRTKAGPLGELIVRDLDSMVSGINAYIDSLAGPNLLKIPPEYTFLRPFGYPPAKWTRNDIVASATLIQSLFATGGGGEHLNALLLQYLDGNVKPGATSLAGPACELWRDLRHGDDPDATRTIASAFPTQSPPAVSEACPQALPPGVALWDPGSFRTRSIFQTNLGILLGLGAGAAKSQPGVGSGAAGASRASNAASAKSEERHFDAALDPFQGSRDALRRAGMPLPNTMSNFIGVTADQTKAGHPIAVMGPQSSYFLPQLLWEVSIRSHGGTPQDFEGRGVVFGDLPYINIGRGVDFAWSATSGGSDQVDIRVSKLCNLSGSAPSREDANRDGFPDADGYLFDEGDGRGPTCHRFYKRTDRWNVIPTPASLATSGGVVQLPHVASRYVLRTHYGPVFATALVSGVPVAISLQRATFFGELETATPYALVGTRVVKDAASFQRLFNGSTGTFNWLYVDKNDIGYIHSGLFPLRDPAQHPELPVWGDGRFEWQNMRDLPSSYFSSFGGNKLFVTNTATPVAQGDPLQGYFEWRDFLPLAAHPHAINPASGTIASWNNSPARGWWAADANGSYGATHRVDMLQKRLDAFQLSGRKHDIASMIEVMADAAYTDLRGQELVPLLLPLLRAGALTADQAKVVDMMQAWVDEGSNRWITGGPGLGAFRRDRNKDGKYDHRAQVVLMDAWYPRLIEKLLPELDALDKAHVPVLQGRDDAPNAKGSAYQQGWFQHMKRVLQMAQGTPGHHDYRRLRCAGDGSAASCRRAALDALTSALADLGGVANSANWDGSALSNAKGKSGAVVEDYDAVEHTAMSFLTVKPIHWVNRPTFQQVVQIFSSR